MDTSQTRPVYQDAAQPTDRRIQDLLERLTVEEKIAQMTSYWFRDLQTAQDVSVKKLRDLLAGGIGQITRVGGSSTLAPVEVARAGNTIQRFLINETRLGIPAILHEESCAGYITLGGTTFPQIIGLTSTWQPELCAAMADEIRTQLLATGARQSLAPVLDIGRDPRWGRIEETFGEDPLLAAQFGMAYIRGLQGGDLRRGVLATGKHFVGHSLSAGGLNCAPSLLDTNTLWNVYLAPFQAAIDEAGLRSMMNAYPELDGEVVAASRAVLTGLLREKLGFTGLVVSDYEAILMIHTLHKAAPDLRSAVVAALRAGIDQELPARAGYGAPLLAALEAGEIGMDEIDTAVRRILEAKFALGLFENAYVDEGRVAEVFETPRQRALANEIARQSLVLLKNEGDLLPLARRPASAGSALYTIAVIGPNADDPRNLLGDYSYASMLESMRLAPLPSSNVTGGLDDERVRQYSIKIPTVLEAIRARGGPEVRVLYAPGCQVAGDDRSGFPQAVAIAEQADVVVLVLGDKSGLTPDCTCGETRDSANLGLPGVQAELVQVVAATGKPVAVVLVNGRPLALPWMDGCVSAILEAWLPGEEGAQAIAAALFGEVNPGGKLPLSVPRSAGQIPLYYNHKPAGGRSYWHGDYADLSTTPLYPFGHGLSYTQFEYSDLEIGPLTAPAGETITIRLTVTNMGALTGDEVVQLYTRDEYAHLPRPVKELKGYRRVRLEPGERCRLTFHLPVDLLAYYDKQLELIVEAGKIEVMLGSSSEDIRLRGEFEISGPQRVRVEKRLFTCPVTVE